MKNAKYRLYVQNIEECNELTAEKPSHIPYILRKVQPSKKLLERKNVTSMVQESVMGPNLERE
jgi:hypothetical protein